MAVPHLDNTAERTALWRALHLEADSLPYVIEDNWALTLADPAPGWQQRPDMKFTKSIRASIVGRARFVEDRVETAIQKGVAQYVILGAGLDSFALRHPDLTEVVQVFEIDQPDTLLWKENRITEHGAGVPENLHLIPVDFEKETWWNALQQTNFALTLPAVISCTGVTLYLSREAILDMLTRIAKLAPGSLAIVSFYAPVTQLEGEDRALMEMSINGAAASGTPMVSFFNTKEVIALANAAGLKNCHTFDTQDLISRYFAGRTDGLLPNEGEIFLVAAL